MVLVFFSVVVLCACIVGTITGLGGGVIIKPIFDLMGIYDAQTVSFYSSLSVFTMCLVSIYKHVRNGTQTNRKIAIYFSLGSVMGGLLGEVLFNQALQMFDSESTVRIIQSVGLLASFVLILYYTFRKERFKTYKVDSVPLILLIGLILGLVAVFLGIGGGPLNIFALAIFFSFDLKESVIYSLMNIAFSQMSKLLPLMVTGKYLNFDLSMVPIIIGASVIGGYFGSKWGETVEPQHAERLCNIVLVLLLILTCINIVRFSM